MLWLLFALNGLYAYKAAEIPFPITTMNKACKLNSVLSNYKQLNFQYSTLNAAISE